MYKAEHSIQTIVLYKKNFIVDFNLYMVFQSKILYKKLLICDILLYIFKSVSEISFIFVPYRLLVI